jgi:hypothetical protein
MGVSKILTLVDKRHAHKSFMCDGWSDSVKPCFLVGMSRGDKGGGGHLLGIEPKANRSWVVLSLWDCAWDGF